jgi:hypothetical protein
MTHHEDEAITRFRVNLFGLYLLKYGLAALTVWAFVYGTGVLALRGAAGLSREALAWGLLTAPLALAPAVWLALRRLPGATAVRALLDRHSQAGGLLMAAEGAALGDWEKALPEVRQPRLRWRGGRTWGLFAAAMAFLALGFLVPQGLAELGSPPRLDVNREADQLSAQLDALKKEKVLDEQRVAALKAKLEQVRRDARGQSPAKTLEALDHLKDLVKKAAREAGERATRNAEALARAERMGRALEKLAGNMDSAQLNEAVKHLAKLALKAASERELLDAGLDKATLEALKNGKLGKEQMKKLAEALKKAGGEQKEMISKLMKAKLLDASALEKMEQATKGDVKELVAYLKENGAASDLTDALAGGDDPDRGDPSRGGGAGKLNFGDESDESGTKFKEQELTPAAVKSLKDSALTGISTGMKQTGKEKAGPARSGALEGAKAGGGSASTRAVLPKHKATISRYFERTADATKGPKK